MMTSRPIKLALLLVLTFVAGGVGGSALTAHLIRRAFKESLRFDNWTERTETELSKRLKLDASQQTQMHGVVRDVGADFHRIFARTLQECGVVIVRSGRRIDTFLTPEQREIHAQMKADLREKLRKSLQYELPDESKVGE